MKPNSKVDRETGFVEMLVPMIYRIASLLRL